MSIHYPPGGPWVKVANRELNGNSVAVMGVGAFKEKRPNVEAPSDTETARVRGVNYAGAHFEKYEFFDSSYYVYLFDEMRLIKDD